MIRPKKVFAVATILTLLAARILMGRRGSLAKTA